MIIPTYRDAAAGAGVGVGSNNPDTRNLIQFNGTTVKLNNPSDAQNDTYELDTIVVNDQFLLATEPKPQTDGMQIYIPRKVRKLIHAKGWVRAPSLAKLQYKSMFLNRYLDPVNAFWDDTASSLDYDKGFQDLTFSIDTTDTTNYPSGVIPIVAYVRSIQRPVQTYSKYYGYSSPIDIVFEMVDPRFYLDDDNDEVDCNNGTNTSHTSITEYPTFPIVTINVTGTPSSTTIIERVTPYDENGSSMIVHLDLTKTTLGSAAESGDTVEVDMGRQTVTLNGNDRSDFLVPGYSAFWPVLPGTNVFLISGTNIGTANTDRVVSYTRAFA